MRLHSPFGLLTTHRSAVRLRLNKRFLSERQIRLVQDCTYPPPRRLMRFLTAGHNRCRAWRCMTGPRSSNGKMVVAKRLQQHRDREQIVPLFEKIHLRASNDGSRIPWGDACGGLSILRLGNKSSVPNNLDRRPLNQRDASQPVPAVDTS